PRLAPALSGRQGRLQALAGNRGAARRVSRMSTHVVILRAGFGGLELSSRLVEDLGADVRVTLIDKNDAFIFGFAKLDVMFGRTDMDGVRCLYRDIAKPGVDFRQEEITAIDPEKRQV